MNLVFLPATAPGDTSCGTIPERIMTSPSAAVYQVTFPEMVWYNDAIRASAITQIRSLDVTPVTLVGFSKSGLGAWNIARAMPDYVSRTIIFDAPVARRIMPPWETSAFYDDDASWRKDLPVLTINEYQAAIAETHRLVLISGEKFHGEMRALSDELSMKGVRHLFLPRPHLKHHWNSGWIEEGLKEAENPGEWP